MPVTPVKGKGGKTIGWKYGQSGKVYKGSGAKKKAKAQGAAINISKKSKEK